MRTATQLNTPTTTTQPLSERQLRDFHRIGWLYLPRQFDADEVAAMRHCFERLERRAFELGRDAIDRGSRFVVESNRIHRVVWCGGAEPELATFGADPRLTRPAAQLLGGRELRQLINQAHFKLPGDGVSFPWHQDSRHRRYGTKEWNDVNGRGSYVQTVVAIDEMTEQNGPLRFLQGSAFDGHVEDRQFVQPSRCAVTMTMKPGDVVMFGPYVFHSSSPNFSDQPRRAFVNGYTLPGANLRRYPGCGLGRPIEV